MSHNVNLVSLSEQFQEKIYRFGIDDNIWFLRDIANDCPKSIFDNPYLNLIRDLHIKYDAKFILNLFFETAGLDNYFNLTMMPDCYRDEWEACSSWLRLAFHAKNEPRKYSSASYNEVFDECAEVHREILRFAGEKSLSRYTTIHFVAASYDGCKALADCGIKGLVCLDSGNYENVRCSYYLDKDQTIFMDKNAIVRDTENGLVFLRNDIVINRGKLDDIVPQLNEVVISDKNSNFVQILLHEQYFYTYYKRYLADYRKRMETSLDWLTTNRYRAVFLEDIL